MTTTRDKGDRASQDDAPSPVHELKDALGGYATAMGGKLAGKGVHQVGKLTDRLKNAGGKGGGGGRGGGGGVKATLIMESVDVGVPLRTAYDWWTRFEDFSEFTKGVRSVSKSDEVGSDWTLKVGPSSRSWKATVKEQVPDERISWTSKGAKGTTRGVVTFHELAPHLTRIVVVVEYYPSGLFEKTGNLWRAQGRRLRLDLKHFARHVTLHADDEVEGWRGEIRDGEVVRSHEDALKDENDDTDEAEDEYEDADTDTDADADADDIESDDAYDGHGETGEEDEYDDDEDDEDDELEEDEDEEDGAEDTYDEEEDEDEDEDEDKDDRVSRRRR
ncbi:SRPBCC family protein [Streptomyces sp. NPDC001595]|uniref:SRPBCC family protein n=1 Tax=Streptomyces sp. NPDC001532 TaxID=3154520 RepID=UPI0033299EF9